MPLRVRKSFKVAPGVRINLSNRGLGGSVGGGGVRYTTRHRGRRRSPCCLNALILLALPVVVLFAALIYRGRRGRG